MPRGIPRSWGGLRLLILGQGARISLPVEMANTLAPGAEQSLIVRCCVALRSASLAEPRKKTSAAVSGD